MEEKTRTVFLKEFTKELILNTNQINLSENQTSIENLEELSERIRKRILNQIEKEYEYNSIKKQETKNITNLPSTPQLQKRMLIPTPQIIQKNIIPISQEEATIKFKNTDEIINELKKLLSDPRILMVECIGKDKFILVRSSLKVMITKIKLSEEEIKNVIQQFSKDTKIPVINGLFRVIKDNLMITAITSEVAGSRFLMKKILMPSQ